MKTWTAAVLASSMLGAVGCKPESSRSTLTIELAPAAEPSEPCGLVAEPVPSTVSCVYVRMCEREGDTCVGVPLSTTGGPHDEESTERMFRLDASRRLQFDAKLRGDRAYDVTVELYGSDGTEARFSAVARGAVRGARLVDDAFRVRLYRPSRVSCAGGLLEDDGWPRGRAFHAAHALPNGDVLVFGGVDFVNGDQEQGRLAPDVFVYLASEQRFARVSGTFARVLFASTVLPGAAPPYRIHVSGGFAGADANAAVLRLDPQQSQSYFRSPLLVAAGATARADMVLAYDPETRAVREERISGQLPPAAGWNVRAAFTAATAPAPVVLGASDAVGTTPMSPKPTLLGQAHWVDPKGAMFGAVRVMLSRRLGTGIVSWGEEPGAALVWGGNVEESSAELVAAKAGELLFADARAPIAVAASAESMIPNPTAFHTITSVAPRAAIVVGGLRVGTVAVAPGHPIESVFATPPIFAFQEAGTGIVGTSVVSEGYSPSIYHTADRLPEDESDGLLVTGGLIDVPALTPSSQLGVIRKREGVYRYERLAAGLQSLARARFGHAVTPLPSGRWLVTGGLTREGDRIATVVEAEVLDLTPPGEPLVECTLAARSRSQGTAP